MLAQDTITTNANELISWAQVLAGAPVAVTVIVFAAVSMYLLLKGHIVLGRELQSEQEARKKAEEESDELRGQLTEYRNKVEADVLPTLVRTTDLIARLAYREEAR